jgi:hypothetical protein
MKKRMREYRFHNLFRESLLTLLLLGLQKMKWRCLQRKDLSKERSLLRRKHLDLGALE